MQHHKRSHQRHEMLQKSSPPPSNATPASQPLYLCSAVLPGAPCRAASILPGTLGCAGRSWLCPARLAREAVRAQRREAGLRMKGPGPAGWHPCLRRLRRKLRHDENAPDLGKFSSATAFHLCVGCVCVCVEILHLPPLLYNFPAAVRPGTRYSQKAAIYLAKLGDNRSCSCLVPLFWLGSGLSCKTNIFPVFPLVSQGKFALISHHLGTMLPRPCGNISVTISHCTTTSSIKGSIFLAQRSTFLCCLSFSAFLHLLTSLSEGSQLFNCMSHCSGMISGGLYIRAKDNN